MTARINSFGITEIGRRDSSCHRDRFLLSSLNHPIIAGTQSASIASLVARQSTLLAVADGVGDCKGGAIASEIAMESLGNYAQQVEPETDGAQETSPMEHWVREGLQQAKRKIEFVASGHSTRHKMATSMTMALVCFPQLAVGQAGDCHCYLIRDGELVQLMNPDCQPFAVSEEQRGPTHGTGILASRNVQSPNYLGSGFKSAFHTAHIALRHHDWLVLATDRLTQFVDEDEICDLATESEMPRRFCHALRQLASQRGAEDNVTAIACNWETNPSEQRSPEATPC